MSLRRAINLKCRSCIYDDQAAGSEAVQIELCASWDTCPLWAVRRVRPEKDRMPYSGPVVEEQGLSPELAAWRLAHPYDVPPEGLHLAEMDGYREGEGGDGESLPDVGTAA